MDVNEAEKRLERTYRAVAAKLWKSLVAFTGDRDIASDALAEAFAQALARGSGVREPDRWVWRVAFRVAAGELKDRRSRDGAAEEESYEMPESAILLSGVLQRLSPKQRAAVVLHYYVDMPTAEIGRVLGMSPATVRVHLSKGRKRLRVLLEGADA